MGHCRENRQGVLTSVFHSPIQSRSIHVIQIKVVEELRHHLHPIGWSGT